MLNDDDSAREKLLTPKNSNSLSNNSEKMDKTVVENEKGGKSGVNEREPDLRLHDAVCDPDNIEEIETLIEDEPHLIFERDLELRSPLHTLAIDAEESAPEIAKLLLGVKESEDETELISIERPNLLNLQDSSNFTALHYAALNRHISLVAALLRWGADPYLQDRSGNTPLHLTSQGMLETAIACGKILLKSDLKKTLINIVNCEEKTALHKAVDERSVVMAKFLLRPENEYDLSLKDSNGWNILHYICSGTEENESLCEIVKAIVNRCSVSQLNQPDNKKRTPLHLTAVQRLPQLALILVLEDKTDVLRVDEVQKTALHYACQNGCYPKGHQCVDVLIGRKFPEKVDVVKYLYRNEDNLGHTPFMYACLNCPHDTVQRYLEVVPQPQYWLTGTYSTLLYKHSPLSLKTLMDKAFSEDDKRTTECEDVIMVDYGPIAGYADPVEVQPQPETKYLKEALYWEYEAQKEVLLHPLVQLFVLRKWQRLGWIILMWVLWQLIWLGAFTTLIIAFYSSGAENPSSSKPTAYVASAIMLIYIVSSLVNETFEVFTVKLSYLLSLTNLTQVALTLLALIAIFPVITGGESPQAWQKYSTATGILLAYILSMRDIGKLHNKIGLVVEVLKQVLIQIVQVLLCCSPLWIGFTLAFFVIFDDEESLTSSFPGPIVKVLVMMTGEFEYNDTFKDDPESAGAKSPMASYRVVRLLFFLSFLIAVPVAFFNLLTGFALDKVMELRERAKVGRIAKQLEHIYFIESILLSLRPLRKVLPHETAASALRKLNVTTAWIDQKWKFYTVLREQIRKPEGKHVSNRGVGGCLTGLNSSFCQVKVPKDVEEQIYSLATANSISATEPKSQVCPKCLK